MSKLTAMSGIYKILCVLNQKIYIGSAVNIAKRWRYHLYGLRGGYHHNRHLQFIYNKHGEGSLQIEVIELCKKSLLINREQHWIDTLNPEININKKAENSLGVKRSIVTRQKLRESHLRNPVYQISKTSGEIIARYRSIDDARKSLGLSKGTISKVCRGLRKTAGGFSWSYCGDWDFDNFEPVEESCRAVIITTPDNNEIRCNSVREAARFVDISSGHVSECCQNKRKSRNGHKFRYAD